ncbi:MAG: hypothetical protein ACLFTE_09785 [Salinivenus sp.]
MVHRPYDDPDQALAQRVNETEAAAAIELHFNAHDGPARSPEMLHWPTSADGEQLATHLQAYRQALSAYLREASD